MTISDPNAELRQGDWLQGVEHIPIATSADEAELTEATPQGVAVLTQCCDLAQNQSGVVHVSPIVKLSGTALADAKAGRTSRYASNYDDIFADLAIVASMSRDTAGTAASVVHRMNAQQRSLFADEIARRFSRFAYPDEVVTVLRPLTEQVRKKARKGGAVGQVLQRVAKLRLECEPSWDATEALTITLLVIVEPQFLPAIPDDYDVETPAMPPEIAMDLTRAAEQILACPLHDPRLIELWGAFGRELLLLLKAGESKATPGLVADLDVDVMRTDEFTYERFRRSVDLDFDYLSTPTADLNVHNEQSLRTSAGP